MKKEALAALLEDLDVDGRPALSEGLSPEDLASVFGGSGQHHSTSSPSRRSNGNGGSSGDVWDPEGGGGYQPPVDLTLPPPQLPNLHYPTPSDFASPISHY